MSSLMMKWFTGLGIVLYVILVMFVEVPKLVSAPDTILNVIGFGIFVLSIPSIYVIYKKVFK
jgi:hypothetical protein